MAICLVLGASGQIGRNLVPRLLDAGHLVHAPSRLPRTSLHPRMHWSQGDLFSSLPRLAGLDAIFSLGPLDGLAHWLEHGSFDGVPHVVAFGSMSAVSKRDSPDADERALSARLLASERRVIDASSARGLSWTLFRPTLIYGAGIDRSLSVLARWGCRLRLFPRVPGARGLRQPVHAQDLADACVRAWDNPGAFDTTFELGGGERLSFATMLDRVRASLPVRAVPIPISLAAIDAAARVTRHVGSLRALRPAVVRRLREDLVADTTMAHERLGWNPRRFAPDAVTWLSPAVP